MLHPTFLFNNIPLSNSLFQEHLSLALNIKLNFSEHIKGITKKIRKTMSFLRKSQQILARTSLLTIYKTFIRSRLDYANIIYDQACNSTFHDKLEFIQYNACLLACMLGNSWCNKRYFKRKNIPRTRFRTS